jgi:CelD/BcsL family acetyltransferase involved in cellulose biosynthesis
VLRGEIIGDPERLEQIVPSWWGLWERSSSATPFQSPAWLVPWWQAFAPGELSVIAVWRGADLVGLAPLYLEHGAAGSRLLPIGISLSDYLDILCVPGADSLVATAMAESALSIGWSQWVLPDLPPGGAGLAIAHPDLRLSDAAAHAACPVIALSGDETLSGCVPARRRRQLRRAHQAAVRRGIVELKSGSGEPQRFLDQLFQLHAARWAGEGGGVLADPAVEQFHRLSLPMLAERHLVRCWVMTIAGHPVGAYYGFHHGARAYAYLGGFDPAYAEESPGAILIGHAISRSLCEGARAFDFLRGREDYKYGWGAVDTWTMRRVWERR